MKKHKDELAKLNHDATTEIAHRDEHIKQLEAEKKDLETSLANSHAEMERLQATVTALQRQAPTLPAPAPVQPPRSVSAPPGIVRRVAAKAVETIDAGTEFFNNYFADEFDKL